MAEYKILQGDCLQELSKVESDSIHLVVTSPPYANQRQDVYGGISESDYPEWMLEVTHQVMRVLQPNGSFILNIKEHVNKGVRSLYVHKTLCLIANEYNFVDEYIWNKTNPFPTGSKKRLKDGFERCFHFTKTLDYQFFPNEVLVESTSVWKDDNKRRKNKGAHNTTNGSGMNMSKRIVTDLVRPSNVITFPASSLNIDHPAVFPIKLPEFFIKLMTKEGDTVLDPFLGSGTTTLAGLGLGRKCIGIESQEKFCKLAETRIQDLT